MNKIDTIGVLAHPRRAESIPIAQQIAAHAGAQGLQTWVRTDWRDGEVQDLVAATSLLVAIGGDGAMLRAARVCAPHHVPVFGVNMGYLGFLTESSPEKWADDLARILRDDYWLESRLMITGEIWREGACIAQDDALNDVVVGRGAAAKTVRLVTYIDGHWATNYNADGLIIATATGSTAYALAAGGSILPPELDNIMMVPVAPHLSMERPVILAKGASLKIVVSPETQTETVVTIDGRTTVPLQAGDEVRVHASTNRSLFIRLQERNYFFRSLMDRMEPRFSPKNPPEDT